ncbi:AI-2E family transporter [Candidatus Woesearchaeota archaeon]|nr:AI-2E family transporter [Candidatus Woesearchaeota archaeon]
MKRGVSQKKIVFSLFILAAFILIIIALKSFLTAIFSGLILAYLFYPVFDKIKRKAKNETFSALVTIAISLIVIILPFALLSSILAAESVSLYDQVQETDLISGLKDYMANKGFSSESFFEDINIQSSLQDLIKNSVLYLTKSIRSVLGFLSNFILNLFVVFIVMFFAMLDKGKFIEFIESFFPFSKKNRERLKDRCTSIVKTVVYGIGLVAVIQGTLGAIGFYIFGLEGAALWGLVMGLCSIVPILGTALVWVPAGIYLLVTKSVAAGIGLLAYGAIIISYSDNISRMKLFSSFGKIHPLVTLFGILMGVPYFGILGFILGPLLLALFVILLHIFHKEYFV